MNRLTYLSSNLKNGKLIILGMLKIEKCDAEFKANQIEVDKNGEFFFDLIYFPLPNETLDISRWGKWSWIAYPQSTEEFLCDTIIKCVAKHYDLEETEICEHPSVARDIAIYLTIKIIELSQHKTFQKFKVWKFDLLKFETRIDEKIWRDISEILIDINTAMYLWMESQKPLQQ